MDERERDAAKAQVRDLLSFFETQEFTIAEQMEIVWLNGVEYQKAYAERMRAIEGKKAQKAYAERMRAIEGKKAHKNAPELWQVRAALDRNEGNVYQTAKELFPNKDEKKEPDRKAVRRAIKQMAKLGIPYKKPAHKCQDGPEKKTENK